MATQPGATAAFREVVIEQLQMNGHSVTVLKTGIPLWHLVHSLGEQVIIALDDLGFVRTGSLGRLHGFRVKELAVSPDGALAVVHLNVTSIRLYDPVAPRRAHTATAQPASSAAVYVHSSHSPSLPSNRNE